MRREVIAQKKPPDNGFVDELVGELDFAIQAENEGGKATWLECFSTRNYFWKRTINGMMLQFIQQLNGQNFYYYYGDTFSQSAGTQLSPYVIQVILGAVSVVGTVPALYLIESWGRRRSLLTGAHMQAACAIIVITGLVGHFTLAPTGTANDQLTDRNKQGGRNLFNRIQTRLPIMVQVHTEGHHESNPTRSCTLFSAAEPSTERPTNTS